MTRVNPHPVETVDELPNHCTICGRRLTVVERTGRFDKDTGAPVLVAYAYCRGSWLDQLLSNASDFHDTYVVSPRPALPPADPDLVGTL